MHHFTTLNMYFSNASVRNRSVSHTPDQIRPKQQPLPTAGVPPQQTTDNTIRLLTTPRPDKNKLKYIKH